MNKTLDNSEYAELPHEHMKGRNEIAELNRLLNEAEREIEILRAREQAFLECIEKVARLRAFRECPKKRDRNHWCDANWKDFVPLEHQHLVAVMLNSRPRTAPQKHSSVTIGNPWGNSGD